MKFITLLLFFWFSAHCWGNDGRREGSDSYILEKLEETGHCMFYLFAEESNPWKQEITCRRHCHKDSEGCFAYVKISEHNGAVYKDSDGNPWVLGKCECNLEIARAIADAVLHGLSKLDNVFCAVFASALDTVLETGLDFLPGLDALEAVKDSVKGAKTFAENGEDAASFFSNYIGQACGVEHFNFPTGDVFSLLLSFPDSWGASTGCIPKFSKRCKKLPEPNSKVPSPGAVQSRIQHRPHPSSHHPSHTSHHPTTGKPPSKTTRSHPTSTSSHSRHRSDRTKHAAIATPNVYRADKRMEADLSGGGSKGSKPGTHRGGQGGGEGGSQHGHHHDSEIRHYRTGRENTGRIDDEALSPWESGYDGLQRPTPGTRRDGAGGGGGSSNRWTRQYVDGDESTMNDQGLPKGSYYADKDGVFNSDWLTHDIRANRRDVHDKRFSEDQILSNKNSLFDDEDLFDAEDAGQWAEKDQTYDDTDDDDDEDDDDEDDEDTNESYMEKVEHDKNAYSGKSASYENDEAALYDNDDVEYLSGVYDQIFDDEVEDLSNDNEKPSHQDDDFASDWACGKTSHKAGSPDYHPDEGLLEEINEGDSNRIDSMGWDFLDNDDSQEYENEDEYSANWTSPMYYWVSYGDHAPDGGNSGPYALDRENTFKDDKSNTITDEDEDIVEFSNQTRPALSVIQIPKLPSTFDPRIEVPYKVSSRICGKRYVTRDYPQWTEGANELPYYSYKIIPNKKVGTRLEFNGLPELVRSRKGKGPPHEAASSSYATEHVFEAHEVATFVKWIAKKMNPKDHCKPINDYLSRPFIPQSNTPGGSTSPGSGLQHCQTPLHLLYDRISGEHKKHELFYLNSVLNRMKETLFKDHKPGGYQSDTKSLSKGDKLAEELGERFAYVAKWVALFEYLKHSKVKKVYRDVSRDMRKILASVDSAYPSIGANSWRKGYDEWQTDFLAHIAKNVRDKMQAEVVEIRRAYGKLLRYDKEQARELNKKKKGGKQDKDAEQKIKALPTFLNEINALSRKVNDIQLDYLKV